jgi:3'-phosphoadenosine 5'-phosphosulfate sulfotransferase (PAPS reductase)/FAD synthetase
MRALSEVEREAAKILEKHSFTVLWSGGKDSTAALLWVLDHISRKDWNILYVEMTGNTHPLCTRYVVETAEKLGVSDRLVVARTRDFFELMDKWGPPLLHSYRWCMYQLKLKAFESAYAVTVSGARRSDSNIRRSLRAVTVIRLTGRVTVSPILEWTRGQVVQYIKDHGLDINPCYALYGHSGNCMFCPYASKRQVVLTLNDPEWRAKILSALEKHKEMMSRGRLSRDVYWRWMKHATQTTLETFVNG